LLFLCIDGITEAADHELEMFGEERLKALMQKQVDCPSDGQTNAAGR
jgi:serine phosphatase RsbU (regulator of sigma subunit)